MVLPSRRLSLAETFCLAFVQTTQPCGTHPGCRTLPSLHPSHRERIPQRASGAAPVRCLPMGSENRCIKLSGIWKIVITKKAEFPVFCLFFCSLPHQNFSPSSKPRWAQSENTGPNSCFAEQLEGNVSKNSYCDKKIQVITLSVPKELRSWCVEAKTPAISHALKGQ